jgi:hypothetical protein
MRKAKKWVRDLNCNIHSDPDDRDAEDEKKVRMIQAEALREAAGRVRAWWVKNISVFPDEMTPPYIAIERQAKELESQN